MNFIHIVGRLGKDPETRYTNDGQKVTTFTVAVSQYKSGAEETIWYRISVWGDRWDKMMSYLKKGKPVMVGGKMRKPTIYTDSNGVPQIGSIDVTADYIEFVPFGPKDENEQGGQPSAQQSYGAAPAAPAGQVEQGAAQSNSMETEDDMPF